MIQISVPLESVGLVSVQLVERSKKYSSLRDKNVQGSRLNTRHISYILFFSDFVSRCFPDVATDRNFIGRVSRNFLRDRDSNWRRQRQDCLELISQPPSRRFIVPVDSQKMQNKSAKKNLFASLVGRKLLK